MPENLLLELQAALNELIAKSKFEAESDKQQFYEQRLKTLTELASLIEEKPDFEAYMREFDESRQDRPLPFGEA